MFWAHQRSLSQRRRGSEFGVEVVRVRGEGEEGGDGVIQSGDSGPTGLL